MTVRIREGEPIHRDLVVGLIVCQFEEHAIPLPASSTAAAVERALSDPGVGFFLLALEGADAVGVAYVSFTWTLEHGGRSAWLEELYVQPEHRDRGVGKMLLDAAIEKAQSAGCAAVDLEVDRDHERAEHLYERAGFSSLPCSRWVRAVRAESKPDTP